MNVGHLLLKIDEPRPMGRLNAKNSTSLAHDFSGLSLVLYYRIQGDALIDAGL
jgi:hypothetical protein